MIKRYMLRFCFEYSNGESWRSQWDKTGPNECDFAWANRKPNIVRAKIESKDIRTKELSTMVECDGGKFINFEWIAVVGVPLGAMKAGPLTKEGTNVGAVLLTDDKRVSVMFDGSISIENIEHKILY